MPRVSSARKGIIAATVHGEIDMADLPEPKGQEPKRKLNKDLLFGILFALFIVGAIAAMVAIDVIADARMGGPHEVHDAAEK